MMSSNKTLEGLLFSKELASDKIKRLSDFYSLILEGNKVQNLTRATEETQFFEDMLCDSLELVKLGWLKGAFIDLGTGAGVPGIPILILDPESKGVLIDSEKRKVDFSSVCLETLKLHGRGSSHWGRIENCLDLIKGKTIISKAVGSVSKIFSWISKCSTWNKLILMKGPKWDEEFKEFYSGPHSGELKIIQSHEYLIGKENKSRKLILLGRDKSE